MKKNILLLIIILTFTYSYLYPKMKLNFNFGINNVSNDLSILKKVNNEVLKESIVPFEIVDNYPPQPVYNFELLYIKRHISFGINYYVQSLGSRLDYEDYSGEDRIDNIVNYNQYGVVFKYYFKNMDSCEDCFFSELYLNAGAININFKSNEILRIFNKTQTQDNNLIEDNSYIEPGFAISQTFYNFILRVHAGYFISFDNNVIGNWDGFRGGISVGYLLGF